MMYEDLALLAQVIESGSFAKASAATGMTKSRLSRRIGEMERRIGIRLIDRNPRHFVPTPLGIELARHGDAIRQECQTALQIAHATLSEPRGPLRIASPSVLMSFAVGAFCVDFAGRYQQVSLTVDATDGIRLPSEDGYDIVLVITRNELRDSEAIARRLVDVPFTLVASPEWIDRHGPFSSIDDLAGTPAIGWWNQGNQPRWTVKNDESGDLFPFHVSPVLFTNNMLVARHAAANGLGMAQLPERLAREMISRGELREVLPGVRPISTTVFALYRSKRSLLASGRVFLDELTLHLKNWVS